MIFANVQLSDEVRIALEEGRLVIFAGAGISLPPPSTLPDFNELACRITGLDSIAGGKEDQELGKAIREKGTDVHLAAAKILYNPNTRPTDLHKQTLRLFRQAKNVRIVTTNFDNHFSDAALSIFKKERVQEYFAPALPLGDDFNGIVYLHGSAKANPRGMVMTDKDFGAAYLTRGWARDFLISLFSKYTVLFIGYSHNDVTTTYLARGLNPSQIRQRMAMVGSDLKPDAKEHWDRLEIPIRQYPINPTNKNNTHQALTDFFIQWATHTNESILYHAKKMRIIARALPPESESVSEYLNYCFRHPQLTQDFCNAIRHPAWIGWLHSKGYFGACFYDSSQSSVVLEARDSDRVVAHWICSFVRRKYPELLLEIIQEHNQKLTPLFISALGHALWVENKKSFDPKFAIWVSLLLSQGAQALNVDIWSYLLQQCRIPEHANVAFRLLELLTTPEIKLTKRFSLFEQISGDQDKRETWSSRKVDYEIIWPENANYYLREYWNIKLKTNLDVFAENIILLATKQLTLSSLLLRSVNRGSDSYDILSWRRSSIAAHEQDGRDIDGALFLLIDAARDALTYWIEAKPQRARSQIEIWWSSGIPLLKRLALYGVAIDPMRSSDVKLKWVLENNLLFNSGVKKEVFDIIANAYPTASLPLRRRLIKSIRRGFTGRLAKRLTRETMSYEQFNLLIWLRKHDATCSLIEEAISKIKQENPNFSEREYPNLNHWSGGAEFIDPKEGFDFDRILSEPASLYLGELFLSSANSAHRNRWNYLANLSALFGRSRQWGHDFMLALAKDDRADTEIWGRTFSAWREVVKSSDDFEWILFVIEQMPKTPLIYSGVAYLISHLIWDFETKISDLVFGRAIALMDGAWNICSKVYESPDDSFHDWMTSAINHEGGCIGDFWIRYCGYLHKRKGKQWKGIPKILKSKMQEALNGTSRIKVYARISMTPWMGHIFAWDKAFAVKHFLPLLDWKNDAIVAQQTWSVLLNYSRGTSIELEKELLPFYRQCAGRITVMMRDATRKVEQFDDTTLVHLGHHMAELAMRVISNPVKSSFFREFLPLLPEKIRGALAQRIGEILENEDAVTIERIWRTWLKEYLELRLVGVPIALSHEETKAMANWCLCMGTYFPEMVQYTLQMPLKGVFAHSIIAKMLKNPAWKDFPVESCRYVVAILKAEDFPHLHSALSELHSEFKGTIPSSIEFKDYEELLYSRGWRDSSS